MTVKGFYYDINKKELMGSDILFVCDGRKSTQTALAEAKSRYRRQLAAHTRDKKYLKPKEVFVRLFKGTISHPSFYTGYVDLR